MSASAVTFEAALSRHQSGRLAEAHNNLGNAEQDCGRLDPAILGLRRATALKPTYGEAQGNLGNALAAAGALQGAAAAYMRALEHSPNHLDILHNFAVTLLA